MSPFPSAVRHLTLDELEQVELQQRLRDFEDALEDGLNPALVDLAEKLDRATHLGLVLREQEDTMNLPLRQLLQDVNKVDRGEKVSPRIFVDELNSFRVVGDAVIDSRYSCWTVFVNAVEDLFGRL